jgi:hypothetical protein
MVKDVRRNDWARFCRNFSQNNRYRAALVRIENGPHNDGTSHGRFVFMGMGLEKRGRLIDAFTFMGAGSRPEEPIEAVLQIKAPKRLTQESVENGDRCLLTFETDDGARVSIELMAGTEADYREKVKAELAHTLFERRGCAHGNDLRDWFEAEHALQTAEECLV